MQTLEIMKEDDVSPKVPLRRNGSFLCVATPLNFAYDKLPEEPLSLTVLKLDGSSFHIQVAGNGTVEDLKKAVGEAFSHCKVSWVHVWGHFCLSYRGQKLLTDDALIGTYGMKDGDELSFVRHLYVGYDPKKNQSKSADHNFIGDVPNTFSGFEDGQQKGKEHDADNSDNDEEENNGGLLTSCRYTFFHLFKGIFSYQKLSDPERLPEHKFE